MAYNPQNDIYGIISEKSKYEAGDKNQDENEKLKARTAAQQYYDRLKKYGYDTVANNLSARNFADSQKYAKDYYVKTGRVTPREYLVQKGKAYNINPGDVNSLISYDGATGEVTFAGKNIGKPDGMADNKSWYKSDYLDKVWDNYIKDNGISRTEDQLAGVNSEEIRDKINRSFGTAESDRKYLIDQNNEFMKYNYNHNPYETDIGKSIMDRFNYLGGVASGNAVADGAAANSGNIDSFSAANAARQKLAFETAGTKAVLDDFNSRLDNAQKRLTDMGVTLSGIRDSMQKDISLQQSEAQRNFDNGQQKALNRQNIENDKVTNLKTKADVTGYVPAEWAMTDDPFFANFLDEKGKLKPEYEKTDFQKLINVAKERGDTDLANKYAVLRGLKIFGNFDKYGQYAAQGDLSYPKREMTETARQFDKQIESAERMTNENNAAQVKIAEGEYQNNKDLAEMDAKSKRELAEMDNPGTSSNSKSSITVEQARQALKDGIVSQEIIDVINKTYGTHYTVDNYPKLNDSDNTAWLTDSGSNGEDWEEFYDSFSGKASIQNFLTDFIKGSIYDVAEIENKDVLTDRLKQGIINNSKQYDIDTADAKRICNKFGVDTSWLSDYKDRWGPNSGKGMKKKK